MTERNERFRELSAIRKRHEGELMRKRGVIGVGEGREEGREEVIVFVERGKVLDPDIPEKIEGRRVKFVKTERFKIL